MLFQEIDAQPETKERRVQEPRKAEPSAAALTAATAASAASPPVASPAASASSIVEPPVADAPMIPVEPPAASLSLAASVHAPGPSRPACSLEPTPVPEEPPSARSMSSVLAEIEEQKEDGVSCKELRAEGHGAGILRQAGFFLEDLKEAGFPLDELRECGFTIKGLSRCGFSVAELLHKSGMAEDDLATELRKTVGCSMEDLEAAGFSKNALRAAGYDVPASLYDILLAVNAAILGSDAEDVPSRYSRGGLADRPSPPQFSPLLPSPPVLSAPDAPQVAGASGHTFEISDQVLGIAMTTRGDWVVIDQLKIGSQAAELGVPVGGTILSVNGVVAADTKAAIIEQLKRAKRPTTLIVQKRNPTSKIQPSDEKKADPLVQLNSGIMSANNGAPMGKYAQKLNRWQASVPNALLNVPSGAERFDVRFPAGTMGFGFNKDEQGELIVRGVQPGSLAEEVGIIAGCYVLAINGKPLVGMSRMQATAMMLSNDIARWPGAAADMRVITFAGPVTVATQVKAEMARRAAKEGVQRRGSLLVG